MTLTFYDWIKNTRNNCAYDLERIHRRLGTVEQEKAVVTPRTWHVIRNMHTAAARDPEFLAAGSELDYREYFVGIFTDAAAAARHRFLSVPLSEAEVAFRLLYRRYLIERARTAKRGQGQGASSACRLSQPARIALWSVGLLAGFCVVPYHDIFAGHRHAPPDLCRPLLFGLLFATLVRFAGGWLFGERIWWED